MNLEVWTPETEQLKTRTDAYMKLRMGEDWRTVWEPSPEMYRLKAMLRREDRCFLMTAGELTGGNAGGTWAGTMTEELYRDAWGTALLDAGRTLLFEELFIDDRRCDEKPDLSGPGLGGIPNETMRGLYEALEGWRIGMEINDSFVLIPDKSFGGWFETTEISRGRRGQGKGMCGRIDHCHPGIGCQFCINNQKRLGNE
ncbi:MAG: hypothetical protein IJ486_02635 [Firmicutes bacterium]|nr:hypothetical protein [Bacillota bacterium]